MVDNTGNHDLLLQAPFLLKPRAAASETFEETMRRADVDTTSCYPMVDLTEREKKERGRGEFTQFAGEKKAMDSRPQARSEPWRPVTKEMA